jgi:hypothetical protein
VSGQTQPQITDQAVQPIFQAFDVPARTRVLAEKSAVAAAR